METKMKKLIFLTIGFALAFSACGTKVESVQPLAISASEAFELYQNGTFLLDVRTLEEWNDFHVENATLIPLDELPDRLNELPKDETIVVICLGGGRSASGRDVLLDAGFTQVTSVSGGLEEWVGNGYPVTVEP